MPGSCSRSYRLLKIKVMDKLLIQQLVGRRKGARYNFSDVAGRLPQPVEALLESALVGELTVLDPRGRPVVHPMLPLYTGDGRVYFTSSVLFSRKLLHLKRNPRAALSITDPVAAPVDRFGQVTIQGECHRCRRGPPRGLALAPAVLEPQGAGHSRPG